MANNDSVILELKKQVEAKKALIKDSSKFSPITNASLELDGIRYNLHTLSKDTLLFVLAKVVALDNALLEILEEETLVLSGFPASEWITDLKARYAVLNANTEKERLRKLENRLHDLLSNDKKVELELDELKKSL